MPPSKPSKPLYVLNIPEPQSFTGEFIYNFYTADERINPPPFQPGLDKTARYVNLNWKLPVKTNFNIPTNSIAGQSVATILTQITSEDTTFSPYYLDKNFSEIASLQQGALALKDYVYFTDQRKINSVNRIKDVILQKITEADQGIITNSQLKQFFNSISSGYDGLSDLAAGLLGFVVYDENNNVISQDFFKSTVESLSLNIKLHKLTLKDFFVNYQIEESTLSKFESMQSFAKFIKPGTSNNQPVLEAKAVELAPGVDPLDAGISIDLYGYLIRRYRVLPDSIKLDATYFINNPLTTVFNDVTVLYGEDYVYSITTLMKVPFNVSDYGIAFVILESRQTSFFQIKCFELTQPPPPTEINFIYDYLQKNLLVYWDFPVNPQGDIKQIQVLRRKSFNEPFELIAQYGFDNSVAGSGEELYKTGELVDVNNLDFMREDLRNLAKKSNIPVYVHVDKDFIVDEEFFEMTSYIYALASVDAHGLVSNYSSQYLVKFDPFKNKLDYTLVCDEGSPRAYPNFNLRIDAFKDAINTTGEDLKEIKIYFNPDYFKVQDEEENKFQVVEAVTPVDSVKPYYLLQIMNLDNQIVKTVKINIKDPDSLSTS